MSAPYFPPSLSHMHPCARVYFSQKPQLVQQSACNRRTTVIADMAPARLLWHCRRIVHVTVLSWTGIVSVLELTHIQDKKFSFPNQFLLNDQRIVQYRVNSAWMGKPTDVDDTNRT